MTHVPKRAEPLDNLSCQVNGALMSNARSQQDRKKLRIAQRPRPFPEQLLSRAIVAGPSLDAGAFGDSFFFQFLCLFVSWFYQTGRP
jgi:hypothetical protein